MSVVSNKIYIQAIDDGSTLHAQLLSTYPLSQAWNGNNAVPDWSTVQNPDIRPVIYVDILHGTTRVSGNTGGTWTYKGQPITFGSGSPFQLVTNYQPTGYSSPVPAIRIIGNLANSGTVDNEVIGYSGTYTLSGTDVTFSVSTSVRISAVTANGIFGQIIFVDNSNVFTEKGQRKQVYGILYGANGSEIDPANYYCNFYLNDEDTAIAGRTITIGGRNYHGAEIRESDVTDNAIIRCYFVETARALTFNAYESIDDQTDPEQMYIQTVVAQEGSSFPTSSQTPDGGGMELHSGQKVQIRVWMGTMTDSTPDASWDTFEIRLHKSNGSIVKTAFTDPELGGDLQNADQSSGYREMTWHTTEKYATTTLTYGIVHDSFDKYLSGYIKATKQ